MREIPLAQREEGKPSQAWAPGATRPGRSTDILAARTVAAKPARRRQGPCIYGHTIPLHTRTGTHRTCERARSVQRSFGFSGLLLSHRGGHWPLDLIALDHMVRRTYSSSIADMCVGCMCINCSINTPSTYDTVPLLLSLGVFNNNLFKIYGNMSCVFAYAQEQAQAQAQEKSQGREKKA